MNLKQAAMATPLYDWLGKRSYAQSGEDMIAWTEVNSSQMTDGRLQMKNAMRGGVYVDVGAYHPKLFSNTYLFYKKGWRGICVEPNPEMKGLFHLARPRDLFLNMGVGEEKSQKVKNSKNQNNVFTGSSIAKAGVGGNFMEYFQFEDGAANTFSASQAKKNQEEARRKLVRTTKIPVRSLKWILDKNLPRGQKIDLMSVDVEGMDLEVLRSNDWKKYRPRVIIAEDLGFDLEKPKGSKVFGFLSSMGYKLVAKTPYSLIFKEKL